MFHKFFDFVGENDIKDSGSIQEFLEQCSGKSFLNGLYRIHFTADIPKWNDKRHDFTFGTRHRRSIKYSGKFR